MTPFDRMDALCALADSPETWDLGVSLARAFVDWASDAGREDPDGLRAFLAAQDACLAARAGWFEEASSDVRYGLSGYWGEDRWPEACRFRSGVAFLVAHGGPWWAGAVAPSRWDAWVDWNANRAGPSSARVVPSGVPASHGWWFIDGGPPDEHDP